MQDSKRYPAYCRIAQSVEQRTVNAEVVSSSLTLTAKTELNTPLKKMRTTLSLLNEKSDEIFARIVDKVLLTILSFNYKVIQPHAPLNNVSQ